MGVVDIDYDGSTAICKVQGCIPSAQDPNVDPYKWYDFNEADRWSQLKVLNAFRTIEKNWQREQQEGQIGKN